MEFVKFDYIDHTGERGCGCDDKGCKDSDDCGCDD